MRYLLLPIIACCLLLTGCEFGTGVDRTQIQTQLDAAAAKTAQIEAFIVANQPLLDQLAKLADETKDPDLIKAAEKMRATVNAAKAVLPTAKAELDAAKQTLAQLEADAAGKVPWYTVVGGALLWLAPRVIGALVPPAKPVAEFIAEFAWKTMATRRQKAADPGSAKPAGA
jgi:hypothetical protein